MKLVRSQVLVAFLGFAAVVTSSCVPAPPTPCTECGGVCVDTQTDTANCGSCGNACAGGTACRAGVCVATCGPGLTLCGNACVDARTNPANCGSCGTQCASDQVCSNGTCGTVCPASQEVCNGTCSTIASDPRNCGQCGRMCPSGAICENSNCRSACGSGQLSCDGGACFNPNTDNSNCGACGVTCQSGEVCSNGMCGTSCSGGLATCTPDGGVATCADTQTDNANCGQCGRRCAAGETCASGNCAATCGTGQTLCTQNPGFPYCATLTTDNANCGVCGTTCASGEACLNGTCSTTCGTGQTLCGADAGVGGNCATLASDNTNCGMCGRACPAGQACSSGACVTQCGGGSTMCGANCVNTVNDRANCGMCGQACAAGEVCAASVCQPTCGVGNVACTGADAGVLCSDLTTDNANCGVCGQACATGNGCTAGFCPTVANTFVTAAFAAGVINLSTTNITNHVCPQGGEMVRYSVTGLTATTATVSVTPSAGCLVTGDEVLLINLQGTATANGNVGNYELRRVTSVNGTTVTFQTPKTKFYGDNAADDTNLGTMRTNQRVIIQRVPNFGTFLTGAGTLTADAWNGTTGGVFALRATRRIQINGGGIDMAAKGYDGAPVNNVVSTSGRQGESINGLGVADERNNLSASGAGRGEGGGCPGSFNTTGHSAGGAGHAIAGNRGTSLCSGAGGAAIGSTLMTKIFLGGGGASGGTDNSLADNPPGGAGGKGGGIVMLLTPLAEFSGPVDVFGAAGQGDAPGTNCPGNTSTTSCWDFSGPGGGGAGGSFFSNAVVVNGKNFIRAHGGNGGDGRIQNFYAGAAGKASYGRVFPMETTCADLNVAYGDSEHLFAFDGDASKPYLAFCTGVGGSTPRMYLSVYNRGATQNFATYDGRSFGPGTNIVTTRFTRYGFNPLTRRIDPNDFTFSTSSGSVTGGPFGTCGAACTVNRWPAASTGDCVSNFSQTGTANLDLRGLPFAVSTRNAWTPVGFNPGGSSIQSIGAQVVAITGGGFCGENFPSTFANREIELTYVAAPQTCTVLKTNIPTATDGVYAVSPDPAYPALPVTCDMTFNGGGWMLLQDSNSLGGNQFYFEGAMPIVPGSAAYAQLAITRAFANAASVVQLRTAGLAGSRSATTTAGATAMTNLRAGDLLNRTAFVAAEWTGPMTSVTPSPFTATCAVSSLTYPNLYHACGNANGLHWLSDVSKWNNSMPANEQLQLWVK
ncbi:MAG: hypothetical protein QM817_33955 [Archangium sp.]